jgi:hypothetical protein
MASYRKSVKAVRFGLDLKNDIIKRSKQIILSKGDFLSENN